MNAKMRIKNKKFVITSIVMALMMALTMVPGMAFAADADYGSQGLGGNQLKLTNPSDITVVTEDKLEGLTRYNNKINVPVAATANGEISFGYTLSAGLKNFKESTFDAYKSQIQLCNGSGEPINGIAFELVGFDSSSKTLTIKTNVSALNAGDYILRFGPDICGNNADRKLGCYIDFAFALTKENQGSTDNGNDRNVKVTGVQLDKEKATLTVGKSRTWKATVLPANATDKAVTWKSSNNKVAKVNSKGKVTAVAPGKATITVATKDGGFTKKAQVTVRPKAPSITLTGKKGSVTIKYKKVSGVDGYQFYWANTKKGKYHKFATRTQGEKRVCIDSKLKEKHVYYYKAKTYKTVKGKKIYSSFSTVKKVKTK